MTEFFLKTALNPNQLIKVIQVSSAFNKATSRKTLCLHCISICHISYSSVCSLLVNEGGEAYVSYPGVNCLPTCKWLNHRGVGYPVCSVNTYHCVGLLLQGDT